MIAPDLLAPAAIDDTPRFIDETTGEIIDATPAAELTAETLMTYAQAKSQLDLAQLALAERMQELQRQDPQATELATKVLQARAITASVEATLEEAFSPEDRKAMGNGISLDFGFVRVTWPKPAARWTMREKPERIARTNPELAQLLGIEQVVGNPSAPRITIRPEKLAGGWA